MTSRQLVIETMKGNNPGRTPLYGWVSENLADALTDAFGSVENFEDHYAFDLAHIFGCPGFYGSALEEVRRSVEELTPDVLLDVPMREIDSESDYAGVIAGLQHHRQRDRFCYVQTDGIFEAMNGIFGIENHLMYLALYPDELKELYTRLADWNIKNAENLVTLGVDDIHISDDWGSQKTLLFSRQMFKDYFYPQHRKMVEAYRHMGVMTSLHSDGCIAPVLDLVADIGYDFIHPWQENCHMPYSLYLDQYQDRFGILGGICVQPMLGFHDLPHLRDEIHRIFSILKGKRWACCTTHFVQSHCTVEELVYAYDLMRRLSDAPV